MPLIQSLVVESHGWLTMAEFTNLMTIAEMTQYRSSYYVQNASFVRMDNISLGYTFNKLFNAKQSARVYVTVQNPFVITKYDGLDPEISGSGVDNNIYPCLLYTSTPMLVDFPIRRNLWLRTLLKVPTSVG